MTAFLRVILFALFALSAGGVFGSAQAWTYAPAEGEQGPSPWRIVVRPDGFVESQSLISGVRNTKSFSATVSDSTIEFPNPRGGVYRFEKSGDTWVLRDDRRKRDLVFVRSESWDEKFEAAPPVPKTVEEALSTFRKVLSPEAQAEIRAMKMDDLIGTHFGFGMNVRSAFGLWDEESPLLEDLGGGHPDDASMRLIYLFWKDLQKDKEAEPGATDNPDDAQRI
jgi:hypothetical protein